MAQSFADSPTAIYDALVDDTDFMDMVGSYTFTKGNTAVDSISIVTPGADLPQLKSQSGLEVVIHDSGIVMNRKYLTDSSDPIITWKVFLIAWAPANGVTVMNAAKRMLQIFGNSTAMETVATADGLGSLVQTMVLIPSDCPILI